MAEEENLLHKERSRWFEEIIVGRKERRQEFEEEFLVDEKLNNWYEELETQTQEIFGQMDKMICFQL